MIFTIFPSTSTAEGIFPVPVFQEIAPADIIWMIHLNYMLRFFFLMTVL